MGRKPDILTLMLIGPLGLPDCCPHWDDDGKTPSYCPLALGMAVVLSGMAGRMARAAPTTGAAALAIRLYICLAPQTRAGSSAREEIPSLG